MRRSNRNRIKPTLLDRAISYISPVHGLRRAKARAVVALAGGYLGARRDRPSMSQWSAGGGSSADFDTLGDLDVLRGRSRDLVRNDPLARSAISTKAVHVIGTGHVVRPEIDSAFLGISEDEADAWEERALAVWNEWAESADCDITRTQSFPELEDLVYRSRVLSGDVFVIRRFKKRAGRMLATAVQVVEADRVSNPNFAPDSDRLAGGVEMDADGAPIAYHIADRHLLDRHLSGAVTWRRIPAFDPTGRRLVLHVHGVRERPDMTRYAPALAPVIEALKQRSRYSEAELTAAVVSASFAIALKSPDGDLGDGLVDTAQASETGRSISLTEPGMIVDLATNEEIQSFSPGRPNAQFAPFIDAIAREIGAGTDLPHELIVKQFQASYSASRAALEMAWQFFKTDRAMHVRQFGRPVYEDVISEAVARGILDAPGFFADPLRRRAWLGSTWMGPARVTIDPVKDATADEKYLEMGVTSLTRIAAERFGMDYRVIRRRREQDGSNQVGAASASAPAQPDDQNDDEGSDKDQEDL